MDLQAIRDALGVLRDEWSRREFSEEDVEAIAESLEEALMRDCPDCHRRTLRSAPYCAQCGKPLEASTGE